MVAHRAGNRTRLARHVHLDTVHDDKATAVSSRHRTFEAILKIDIAHNRDGFNSAVNFWW